MYSLFWEPVDGHENKHKCKGCGILRTQRLKSGYSNLKEHLNTVHPDWADTLRMFYAQGGGPMDLYVAQISPKAKTIHGWLEWTIIGNQPFSFCEGKLNRKYSTLSDMDSQTLMKYMKLTADKVRDKVTATLPNSFGLIIDGWTQGSAHYSAVFAAFVKSDVVQTIMLSCNVAEDINEETEFDEALEDNEKRFGFTADDWFDVIVAAMAEYEFGLNVDNFASHVEFISADNCSTNRSLSTKTGMFHYKSAFMRLHIYINVALNPVYLHLGVPLIGCYSHKLSLAVSSLIGNEAKRNRDGLVIQEEDGLRPVVTKIDRVMANLKTLKTSALLRAKTRLRAERMNKTRWSSLFSMLVKWKRIREFVVAIDNLPPVIVQNLPTPTENIAINSLVSRLSQFESVSKALQGGGDSTLTLYEARRLFDKLLTDFGDDYPLSELKKDSYLINNKAFENGIIKLQGGEESLLNRSEKEAVSIFLLPNAGADIGDDDEANDEAGYAERILDEAHKEKRRKVDSSKYRSTIHVLPQSNLCERLFSLAKLIMTDLRQSMNPSTLNDVLFLKSNCHLWNANLIQEIWNEHGNQPDVVIHE